MTQPHNQDWLDQVVEHVTHMHPMGKLIVSSGHSPSGTYHVGTLREVVTANAIAWALRRAGREAEHWDVVDDFDAFRKLPAGVPQSYLQYVGVPLALVPDPDDCHESYGAHYLQQLNEGLAQLGATPDVQLSGYQNYQAGELVEQMIQTLDNLEKVRQILVEVGKRDLEPDWSPVQILDDNNNLRNRKYTGWNSTTRSVSWIDKTGQTGQSAITSGQVTLGWRLDWPARWAKWSVSAEPFGRDHATKGGSYDTGKVLVEQIFGGQSPYPVPYEFINTIGETKKMSKSSGNVLTPKDALEVMPAEILRYFIINPRPSRTLNFDSGLGLFTLVDEFSKARTAQNLSTTMSYAQASGTEVVAQVPFNHLVAVFQAARENIAEVRSILVRTGHKVAVEREWPVIERELKFVKNWLEKYAPDSVKFDVQEGVPRIDLPAEELAFLVTLADLIEVAKDLNGQGMHDAIYAAAEVALIKPGQAFVALYQVILGQDSGPKAGWFLASLDKTFLVNRLRLKA